MGIRIDKELLVKYVRGQCTEGELEQVKQFLLQPEWREALEELLEEDFKNFVPGAPGDTLSEQWNRKFQERYGNDVGYQQHIPGRQIWLRYAAALIVLMVAAVYGFRYWQASAQLSRITMMEHYAPRGERLLVTLPDSSRVMLEAGSYLKFPSSFTDSIREVQLKGEAFFDVVPNPAQPFIVRSGTVQTRVLGTSFKVDAFDGHTVVVSVATGRVRVDHHDPETQRIIPLAVLKPGQEVLWDPATARSTVSAVRVEDLQEWRSGKLIFVNSPLHDIAEKLGRRYNADIRFSDEAIENYHLSLTIKETAPLSHALDIICATAHLAYHRNGHEIIISNNKTHPKKGG